ncbi:MAG: hypothetical protein WBL61_12990 [Bryobacteraceae bacterium]
MGRRSWLAAGLALPLLIAHAASLDVAFDGDTLRPVLPDLHFISGRPLERLKDAQTVVFLSQITLLRDDRVTPFRRAPQRFYVSYDIWEGRFKVTIPGATPESRLGLTAEQAEAWCVDNMVVSALGVAPDQDIWMRFDLRTVDPKDAANIVSESGISISGLIEFFSRRPDGEPHWVMERRLRLADLRRTPSRRNW